MSQQQPTATGYFSVPLRKLAELVAESNTFQTACGLTAPDAAAEDKLIEGQAGRKHIFYPTAGRDWSELIDLMPVAVCQRPGPWKAEAKSAGQSNHLRPQGAVQLTLAAMARHLPDEEISLRTFENFTGAVLADMLPLSGADDRLNFYSIEEIGAPSLPDEAHEHSARGQVPWVQHFLLHYR